MSASVVQTQRRRSAVRRGQSAAAWLLIAPFAVIFLALFIVPLVYSGYLSLFTEQLIGGYTFSGLANYARVLTDPQFWSGFGRVVLFLLIQVPIMLIAALALALALDSGRLRGSKAVRLLAFMPYAVPGIVATLMWGYLYGPDFGLFSQVTDSVGIGGLNLLSAGNILGSIMNVVCWEFIGYNMIILYAALRAVPEELYEAAEIDGAGQFRIAWSVKIPAIRSAILLTIIFSIIGAFQLFNEPAVLSIIAPNAIGTDFSPNLYAYREAFTSQDVSYSAAIAFVLGAFIVVISYVVQTIASRREWA